MPRPAKHSTVKQMQNGEIATAEIAASAVTTAKILDANVTSDKLATGSVTEAKIGTGAVTSGKLGASAVETAKINNDAVTQDKVADDAVGAAQLKIVERNITIAGGAASGTVTNAADINGTVIGVIPYAACESAIKDVTFTMGTGAIAVELLSAQTGGVDATVTAVILQA